MFTHYTASAAKEVSVIRKRDTVFMFGGQGSQYYQMGIELYRTNSVFRFWMQRLDKVLSEIAGISVLTHLYDERKTYLLPFDNLTYSHPALFIIQYSLAQTLIEQEIYPDIVLGLSLGEYVAAAIAGAVEPEEMLECLTFQSHWVQMYCEKGGMITILAPLDVYRNSKELQTLSNLVATNYDGHFVVAGVEPALSTVEQWLKDNNVLYQRLPITYPFHSTEIEPIKDVYLHHLSKLTYKKPAIPSLSCSLADFYYQLTPLHLWQVTRGSIRLADALEKLDEKREYTFIDLSPSGTMMALLTNIWKNVDREFQVFPIITRFNRDSTNLSAVIDQYRSIQH